jgi:transcriptional regulator with XRE-family HTH domain
LSRLESGGRRPTLELLLPLACVYGVPLDDLVGASRTGDPRIHLQPIRRHAMTFIPLTRRAGGVQAFKMLIPSRPQPAEPTPQTHGGYEWVYVLNGRLRLVLGARDLVLSHGEAAEFDTALPHWPDQPTATLSKHSSYSDHKASEHTCESAAVPGSAQPRTWPTDSQAQSGP